MKLRKSLYAWLAAALVIGTATICLAVTDPFNAKTIELNSPAINAFAITPSDATNVASVPRAIYVGVGGDIAMTLAGDTDGVSIVFKNVPTGSQLSYRAKRVWATGTTATNLVAVY